MTWVLFSPLKIAAKCIKDEKKNNQSGAFHPWARHFWGSLDFPCLSLQLHLPLLEHAPVPFVHGVFGECFLEKLYFVEKTLYESCPWVKNFLNVCETWRTKIFFLLLIRTCWIFSLLFLAGGGLPPNEVASWQLAALMVAVGFPDSMICDGIKLSRLVIAIVNLWLKCPFLNPKENSSSSPVNGSCFVLHGCKL